MKRICLLISITLLLPGCCMRERQAMSLLPEGAILPYAELLDRAKVQVNVATEAFYVDNWAELKKAALALEQTARYFPKAPDIPKDFKKDLPDQADVLSKEALQLATDAQARDIKAANTRLQTINLKIREFHAGIEQ